MEGRVEVETDLCVVDVDDEDGGGRTRWKEKREKQPATTRAELPAELNRLRVPHGTPRVVVSATRRTT